ncbi:interstitial collagenase-like [Erythrolamprus reginae]|uniref:interstitial collagenase-like n=1 Tax=Erythrolamprus reginae TaxID=121349 RepID=UPI00396C7E08
MSLPAPAGLLLLLLLALPPLPCPRAAPTEEKSPVVITFPGDALSSLSDRELAARYLQRYGYLEATNPEAQMMLETPLKAMQKRLGLPETGELDAATLTAIRAPRCGVPDVGRYATRRGKWDHTDLTYRVVNYSPDLNRSTIDDTFVRAFDVWSQVTPLTFTGQQDGEVDILIQFVTGDHGDNDTFDGEGGVLAHAFYPGKRPISGDAHFDEDELWTLGSEDDYSLLIVAAHEFGHSLGLKHSSIWGALMYPRYVYQADLQLHEDDIKGIQSLYGKKSGGQHQAPLSPSQARTEAEDSSYVVDEALDFF